MASVARGCEMRQVNWLESLLSFVESRRGSPHVWGKNDCCLFAADAILAMTGIDHAADFRGTYSTEAQANEIIGRYGSLDAFLTHFLGEPAGPVCARRGDVVTFLAPNGLECVGVCLGTSIACPGDAGLNILPMSAATKSWRVA